MATSKQSGGGFSEFLRSRKNQVGMVCAILVVVLHIAFGLGFLWPIAAVAAYGAGAALTPPQKQKELPPAPLVPTPQLLEDAYRRTTAQLRQAEPVDDVLYQAYALEDNIRFVLGQWEHLEPTPQHRQTIWNIVKIYYPEVVGTYLAAPNFREERAVAVVVDSLSTLTQAAERIKNGIVEDNLRAMDSQANFLRVELGELPGLDDAYSNDDAPDPGGYDRPS
ncbi:hypothetical protein [Corynebacterium timonense]|uniref:5-bromo-4-chloroindolyl phosphate hydrolysis protein n=1 Tax=Corynebacterium timonense TaxID=441500 RepID=A0A1H1PGQ9_9CORY|nr:hypothetical protein [Corynebacterium timonense]SDS10432.1 hypothetical protein SAMN04488539_1016 [Corynebacterium timonense]